MPILKEVQALLRRSVAERGVSGTSVPSLIRFSRSAHPRLSLSDGGEETVRDFSVTHSEDDMIVVISTARREGVDIERVGDDRCSAQHFVTVFSPPSASGVMAPIAPSAPGGI
jgi:phosphopantetheinyl transferase